MSVIYALVENYHKGKIAFFHVFSLTKRRFHHFYIVILLPTNLGLLIVFNYFIYCQKYALTWDLLEKIGEKCRFYDFSQVFDVEAMIDIKCFCICSYFNQICKIKSCKLIVG